MLSIAALALGRLLLMVISVVALSTLLAPCSVVGEQHNRNHGHAEAMVMETIVVTAERIDDYVEKNPNQVVVLRQEEIRQRSLLSVEEALSTMPGVDVKHSSGGGSRISIRGSGKSGGVLVLVNGRPMNTSQYGGVALSTIPVDMIKSIMVFKPPVPVWVGPGASDGAINIVVGGEPETQKKKKMATRLRGAFGAYGLAEGTISHQANLDSGAVMVAATGKHLDGKRTNSDRDSSNLSLHWDRELSADRRLEIDGRYFASGHGSAGPVDNPTPAAIQSYQKTSFDSRLDGIIADSGDYRINLYGDRIHLKDQSQSGSTSTIDNLKWGLKGENNWYDGKVWALRLSGILERDEVQHTLSGTHQRTNAGLGVQTDRNWKALTVTFGLREDYTSDFNFNPGLSSGLSYELTERLLIKANVGYTVNIPTFGQLYQPSHGSIDQVRGNPDLDEEKVCSYDASVEYQRDKSHFLQISFFRSETRHPIVYLRGTDQIYQPINANRGWRHGVETTFKYEFDTGATLDSSVIIQDSKIEETGNKLPYTPRLKLQLSLRYPLKRSGTRLETTARYCSEQYSEVENRTTQSIDAYTTVDFKAIQPFKLKSIAAEWFVNIENIFNAEYEVHYGYPDDGIRFVSGLNLTF